MYHKSILEKINKSQNKFIGAGTSHFLNNIAAIQIIKELTRREKNTIVEFLGRIEVEHAGEDMEVMLDWDRLEYVMRKIADPKDKLTEEEF